MNVLMRFKPNYLMTKILYLSFLLQNWSDSFKNVHSLKMCSINWINYLILKMQITFVCMLTLCVHQYVSAVRSVVMPCNTKQPVRHCCGGFSSIVVNISTGETQRVKESVPSMKSDPLPAALCISELISHSIIEWDSY